MARQYDAKATRQRLLWAAFREFHRVGYRGADIERILTQAGVTKGALYYHFRGKRALGYAVIEEILSQWIVDRWLKPLESSVDLLDGVAKLARWGERVAAPEGLSLGCPLNNLSQELCGADEGFRLRLEAIYEEWERGLSRLLAAAQGSGVVRSDVEVRGVATFIIAAWEGSIGLAKSRQAPETLRFCRRELEAYLGTLRCPGRESETNF
jgi:AcrR family transcriptional regulator